MRVSDTPENLAWTLGAVAVIMALVLLRRPLGAVVKLAARTGVGLACLSLLAPLGELLGMGLGVNLLNALILGVLGGPGLGLLLMLRWTLR